jgi:hypothetical protein
MPAEPEDSEADAFMASALALADQPPSKRPRGTKKRGQGSSQRWTALTRFCVIIANTIHPMLLLMTTMLGVDDADDDIHVCVVDDDVDDDDYSMLMSSARAMLLMMMMVMMLML